MESPGMANFNSFLACSLALLLMFFSVAVAESCTVSVIGGGCPNLAACTETCRPCYIGNGQIRAFCQPAGGGIPYDQCICSFYEGAPCIPRGCPKQPPLSVTTSLQ